MVTQPPTVKAFVIALVFSLSVFGFTLYVWRSFGGSTPLEPRGYRVHAYFSAGGNQIARNADVRIAGVTVGKVKSVKPAGLETDAELEIDRRFAPIRANSRAILRVKTLLGETFVALTSGSPAAPVVPEGGALRRTQIDRPQSVDEVLSAFDTPTRQAFASVLTDFGRALAGRGDDLNATLGNAPPATERLHELVDLIVRRDVEVRSLIRDTGTTLRTVGRRESEVRRLVRAGDSVLSATAARDTELASTIRALPPLLRQARSTLREAEATAIDAAPTLRTLRPVTPLVAPALRQAITLVPEVAGLAQDLEPAIDEGKRGLPAASRTVNAARPLLSALNTAGRDLVPALATVDAYKVDLASALAKQAAATQATDGKQHYLRVLFLLLNESLVGFEQREPTNRANAYIQPGGLAKMFGGGPLEAFDCSNTGNRQQIPVLGPGGAPPCLQQKPFTVRGKTAQFPGPERDAP